MDRSRKTMCIIKKTDQLCVLLEEKLDQTEKNERPRSDLKKPCVLLKKQDRAKKNSTKTICIIRR